MKKAILLFAILFVFISSKSQTNNIVIAPKNDSAKYINYQNVKTDTLIWFDSVRKRQIPVAIYFDNTITNFDQKEIIIFSHGYGENQGGGNFAYSYLTKFLATKGYIVVSIQHELPNDELLPTKGNLYKERLPNWERGVQNINFVLGKIKSRYPNANYEKLTLIGHSNGGDISMLFATKYPSLLYKVISLDNLRMPLPRKSSPQVFTIRSANKKADAGVLPTIEEQKEFSIKIDTLNNTLHNNMNNSASKTQRIEICNLIFDYLK